MSSDDDYSIYQIPGGTWNVFKEAADDDDSGGEYVGVFTSLEAASAAAREHERKEQEREAKWRHDDV